MPSAHLTTDPRPSEKFAMQSWVAQNPLGLPLLPPPAHDDSTSAAMPAAMKKAS